MRVQPFAALLFCGLRTLCPVEAQSVDRTLVREVMTVRDEVARSRKLSVSTHGRNIPKCA